MTDNKTELLQAIKISRTPSPSGAVRNKNRNRLLILAIVLLAAFGSYYIIVLRPQSLNSARATVIEPVAPTKVTASTIAPSVPVSTGNLVASGYVVARRKATIAAEITGKIVNVTVDEGMTVKEGQELATLDSTLAEIDLANSRAKVASAQAFLESVRADQVDAQRIVERTRSLMPQHFATEADLTKNEAHAEVLLAQVKKAEADLSVAKTDVDHNIELVSKHHIRAPYDGIVVDKNAQTGEIISPLSAGGGFTRTGVCTIVDMNSLEFEVDVNEAFIHRVAPKQKVEAVLDAYPDFTIPASVIAIIPTANRDKATIKVRIAIIKKDPRILPDMAVKVTFLSVGSEALPPPNHGLLNTSG